jgi:hypothetical protein
MKDESIIKCPSCGLILYKDDSVWHDAVKDPPKENQYCLVVSNISISLNGNYVEDLQKSLFIDGEFTITHGDYYGEEIEYVLYWMPLPQPPDTGWDGGDGDHTHDDRIL